MSEIHCEIDCMIFSGGDKRHSVGCYHYPESMTKMLDDAKQKLHQLEEENREMQGILKLVEWSNDTRGFKFCPMCGNLRPNHSTNCRLSKILNRK